MSSCQSRWCAARLSTTAASGPIVGLQYRWKLDRSTAAGRDNLLLVGGALFAVCAIHNTLGYLLGYLLSRASGLDRSSSRSVAFEVGVQNGGMAAGLAVAMGKLSTVGLAPAIFSPWMNVSGSLLANYWKRRPGENPGNTDKND